MKKLVIALAVVMTLALTLGMAIAADSQPSAKATATINKLYAIGNVSSDTWPVNAGWTTVHSQQIKTANAKDLFIDVALQTGIFTRTKSELKTGGDTSTAQARVEVKVLVDGAQAEPGEVIFDKRVQTLNTELYEALLNAAGSPISNIGYVELILETLQAHSFNFVKADVPSGVHTVTVQARVVSETSGSSATARGAVGMGSTAIECVRMIKGEDIIYID
jgi:hypothetical protein